MLHFLKAIIDMNKFLNGSFFDILNHDFEPLMDSYVLFSEINETKTKN